MSETAATDAAVTTATEAPPEAPKAPEAVEAAPESQPTPEKSEPRGDRLSAKKGALQRAREAYEQRTQRASEEAKQRARGTEGTEGSEAAPAEGAASEDGGQESAPKVDAKGNLHGEDGKFVPKEGSEPTEPAAEGQAAGTPKQDGATRASEVPEGHVKIELDESHPWRRSAGDKPYFIVPAEQEQLYRTAVNEATRRKDVERAEREMQQVRRQNIEMATRLRLAQEGQVRSLEDPKLQKLLGEIEQHYPDEFDYVKTALETAPEARVRQEVEQGMAQEQARETARTFLGEVESQAPQKYWIWAQSGQLTGALARELGAYGDFVDARMERGGPGPDPKEFFQRLDARYIQDPRVQAAVQEARTREHQRLQQEAREQARKEIEAEAATKREATKREVATRHETVRGPARLRGAVQTGQRAMEPAGEDEQLKKASPGERQRLIRQRVVDKAREMAG